MTRWVRGFTLVDIKHGASRINWEQLRGPGVYRYCWKPMYFTFWSVLVSLVSPGWFLACSMNGHATQLDPFVVKTKIGSDITDNIVVRLD